MWCVLRKMSFKFSHKISAHLPTKHSPGSNSEKWKQTTMWDKILLFNLSECKLRCAQDWWAYFEDRNLWIRAVCMHTHTHRKCRVHPPTHTRNPGRKHNRSDHHFLRLFLSTHIGFGLLTLKRNSHSRPKKLVCFFQNLQPRRCAFKDRTKVRVWGCENAVRKINRYLSIARCKTKAIVASSLP